jgi:hypothetical protein
MDIDRSLLVADAREVLAKHGCDYICTCPARLAFLRFKYMTGLFSGSSDRYEPKPETAA